MSKQVYKNIIMFLYVTETYVPQIFKKFFLLLKLSGANVGIIMGWDVWGGLYPIYPPPLGLPLETIPDPTFCQEVIPFPTVLLDPLIVSPS